MIIDFRYIIDSGKVISFRTGDVSYGGNDDDDVIADWLPATAQIRVIYVDENGRTIDTSLNQSVFPPFKRSQIPSGMGIENVSLRFRTIDYSITQITKLNTKGMRCFDWMFEGCDRLNFYTLPKLDMSEVTRTQDMFYGCLTLAIVPELDTSKVTDMGGMFSGCSNLVAAPALDTSNVTNMLGMFRGCANITTIPMMDTSKVTDMSSMFKDCTHITTIPALDTSNVTNMGWLFQRCTNLQSVPQLNTSRVRSMLCMFDNCTSLTEIPQLDTSNTRQMRAMFDGCINLTSVPAIVAPNCIDFENMFLDCPAIQEIDITTPAATNLKGIFRNCSDLRKVKNMYTGKATAVNNFFSTTATDYKLTEIPTMDFSSCTASNTMNGFFVNRKGIHHMDITGAIHRGCTFHSVFDEDTLVQILQACNRTTTTYSKKMAFKDMQTLTDTADGQYAALMSECTDKGWTFTNFTLNPYETAA